MTIDELLGQIFEWIEVIPLIPSVKEPERVEQPPRPKVLWLCARRSGKRECEWFYRLEDGRIWRRAENGSMYCSEDLTDPHPDSDPEAVELWKKETEGKS